MLVLHGYDDVGATSVGAGMMRELPSEYAIAVWHSLRSVLAWADAAPEERGQLWCEGAMERWEEDLLRASYDAALRLPLAALAGELARGEEGRPERLAKTCLCVTDWALPHRAVETALAFAEASALVWPLHPRYALIAGLLHRTHGRHGVGRAWLRHAARVAARCGDFEVRKAAQDALMETEILL